MRHFPYFRIFSIGCLFVFIRALPGAATATGRDIAPAGGCDKSVVWSAGEAGSEGYRIPGVVVTPRGTVLVFAESRITYADDAPKHLVVKRSFDGARTWSAAVCIEKSDGSYWQAHRSEIDPADTPGKREVWTNVAPVVDRTTGRVFFFYALSEGAVAGRNWQRYTKVFYRFSDDDGATWSERNEVTGLLNVSGGVSFPTSNGGFPCDSLGRTFHMPGPGHGIQLSGGRLLLPVWHRTALVHDDGTPVPVARRQYGLSTLYSDDHGCTWKAGVGFGHDGWNMNESRLVEREDGSVYLNARYLDADPARKTNRRMTAVSTDGGVHWTGIRIDPQFPLSSPCDGSVVRLTRRTEGKSRLLYSKNESAAGRRDLMLRISYDEGITWQPTRCIHRGPVSYSDLAVLPDGTILVVYETGKFRPLYAARVSLSWLTEGRDSISSGSVPLCSVSSTSLSVTTAPDPAIPALPFPKGLAGSFTGVHHGALIVAGGSYFERPLWEGGEKKYTDSVFVCIRSGKNYRWLFAGRLPYRVAQGAVVETSGGLVCLGGRDESRVYAQVWRLAWNARKKKLEIENLPALPEACHSLAAVRSGTRIYTAGGLTGCPEKFVKGFHYLSLRKPERWQRLDTPPWTPRFGVVWQALSNGRKKCLYLFGGKDSTGYLTDAYRYDPDSAGGVWSVLAPVPRPVLCAPSLTWGDECILVFSGSDGHDKDRMHEVKEKYRFSPDMLEFHAPTGTWRKAGEMATGLVNAPAVKWNGNWLIPAGETGPGRRTPVVTRIRIGCCRKNNPLFQIPIRKNRLVE